MRAAIRRAFRASLLVSLAASGAACFPTFRIAEDEPDGSAPANAPANASVDGGGAGPGKPSDEPTLPGKPGASPSIPSDPDATANEPPLPLPRESLAVWLRADQGFDAGRWKDASGLGNDAAAPGRASTPALLVGPDGANGLPMLRFDGADDYLEFAPGFSDFSKGVAVYLVVRTGAPPGGTARWERFFDFAERESTDGSSTHFSIFFARCGASRSAVAERNRPLYGVREGTSISTVTESAAGLLAEGKTALVAVVQESGMAGGTSPARVFVNGAQTASANLPVPSSGVRRANYLGRSSFPTYDTPYAGDMGEVVVYNRALAPGEQTKVTEYLMKRWAIEASAGPAAP